MVVFSSVSTVKKTVYKKSVNAFIPRSVVVPLKQDINNDCSWLVSEGDRVEEGQLIARSKNIISFDSTVYSPIPGVVKGFEACVCPDGRTCEGVRINLDGNFSYLGKKLYKSDVLRNRPERILDEIRTKGVINTFVTNEPILLHYDIKKSIASKSKLLVVRLFDEDLSRLTDSLITQFFYNEVYEGALYVANAIEARGIIFLCDGNTMEVKTCTKSTSDFPLMFVDIKSKKYPSSFKSEVIKIVKKTSQIEIFKNISKDSLFIDSSTAREVFSVIAYNVPVISRYVYISGDCIPCSGILKVAIGTSFRELAEQCGGFIKNVEAVIVNGVISGFSSLSIDSPVTKYVKSISFMSSSKIHFSKQLECVSCGNCARICHRGLFPNEIYSLFSNGKYSKDNIFIQSATLCDSCGLCNSVCPSRLPLLQTIYNHNKCEAKNE